MLSPAKLADVARASRLIAREPRTVVFVSPLLRPREIKLATGLRSVGWKVVLLYKQTTPFNPERFFDLAIQLPDDNALDRVTHFLQPRVTHVFSGAVDETILRLARKKPGPLVVDLNDIFCSALYNYLHERFEPTREVLSYADGVVSRDLQPKFAQRYNGFALPENVLLFPEYSWIDGPAQPNAVPKRDPGEVHVVSVGTFTLEKDGMYDSAYLEMSRQITDQGIHFHIYPHWFYQNTPGSMFRFNPREHFAGFYALEEQSSFMHMHDSLPVDELALELPQYDFGLVAGGSERLGQKLNFLTQKYMDSCYSGRIADYLDARLPVLINPEVKFNTWLLKRYGLHVDLNGLFEPGFRDKLLAIKASRERATEVQSAAQDLSLSHNAHRLGEFYERVIASRPQRSRHPLWMRAAGRLPVVGHALQDMRTQAITSAILTEQNRALTGRLAAAERFEQQTAAAATEIEGKLASLRKRYDAQVGSLKAQLNEARASYAAERALRESEGIIVDDSIPLSQRDVQRSRAYGETPRVFTKPKADELVGLLNWSEIADEIEREQGYGELVRIMQLFAAERRETGNYLSEAWQLLNRKNLDQLLRDGYSHFKRTIALNYFTFPIQGGDPQIANLESIVGEDESRRLGQAADELPDDPEFSLGQQRHFRYHMLLLRAYAKTIDQLGLLGRLDEPAEGGPVIIEHEGRRISQDLINSVIEYYSIREGGLSGSAKRVLEIGGGYGRNAFVFGSVHPEAQYVMVDIPPSIYLAQRYLSSVFRDRKIFAVTSFERFEDVREEFEAASFAFLTPHQLTLLPEGYFDLSVNISSFGEMTVDQIASYFAQIERTTRGQFYSKQWQESRNPFDGLVLKEGDYPLVPGWQTIYSRQCAAQGAFFEALYTVGGPAK